MILDKEYKYIVEALEKEASEITNQLDSLYHRVECWGDVFASLRHYRGAFDFDENAGMEIRDDSKIPICYEQCIDAIRKVKEPLKDLFMTCISFIEYTSFCD